MASSDLKELAALRMVQSSSDESLFQSEHMARSSSVEAQMQDEHKVQSSSDKAPVPWQAQTQHLLWEDVYQEEQLD